jgi:hypothetical protein
MALPKSTGTSSDPALMLTSGESGPAWCHTRDPQSGQNAHCVVPPLSVGLDQYLGSPLTRRKSARLTRWVMPKADADCFWHSRQWQTDRTTGSPASS